MRSYAKKDTAASSRKSLYKGKSYFVYNQGNDEYRYDELTFPHKTAKFNRICGQL
jgi:hypothetical protein